MSYDPRMISYKDVGVSIDATDNVKKRMRKDIEQDDPRVLSGMNAFASLCDGTFPGFSHPILVLKTEEPGSKQLLAFEHNHIESICQDLIHHLINDIAVMGATPLYVQDAIICGSLEQKVVTSIVRELARTCKKHGCVLTGGETSVQPGVLPPKRYILTANIVGVVEKKNIIDGSRIEEDDVLLGIASNGLHTNGYSLVRTLLQKNPKLLHSIIDDQPFLDIILRPHACYLPALKKLFSHTDLHAAAHITGGGIPGNLPRILPKNMSAHIDLSSWDVPTIFNVIRREGDISDEEMFRTFNLGIGLIIVIAKKAVKNFQKHFQAYKLPSFCIGTINQGNGLVIKKG